MTTQIVTDTPRARTRAINADRRTRMRLRELCDEVLASYRVAKARDLFDEKERNEARAVLARIAPLGRA
ncbi:MAG TPA: hypothetical protein VF761_01405 [Gemmatimonadaceae bacterium]